MRRGEEQLVFPFQGLLRLQRKVIFVVLDIFGGGEAIIEAFIILFCLFLASFHVQTKEKHLTIKAIFRNGVKNNTFQNN